MDLFHGNVLWSNRGDLSFAQIIPSERSESKDPMIKKKLKIEGMHCSSCCLAIDMDLEDLEGIINVKTSYAKAETEIEFDPAKLDEEQILQTIKKSGYEATPIET